MTWTLVLSLSLVMNFYKSLSKILECSKACKILFRIILVYLHFKTLNCVKKFLQDGFKLPSHFKPNFIF